MILISILFTIVYYSQSFGSASRVTFAPTEGLLSILGIRACAIRHCKDYNFVYRSPSLKTLYNVLLRSGHYAK